MEQFIFYLSAILLGVLLSVALEFVAKLVKKKRLSVNVELDERTHDSQFDISEDHIQDCILPNNRGKSIDIIVENLKAHNVDPDFAVDFS